MTKKGPPAPGPHLLSTDQDLHFLRRFTYGPTPGLIAEVARNGRHKWFEKQLTPSRVNDPGPAALLKQLPYAGMTPPQIYATHPPSQSTYYEMVRQLQVATLVRQVFSARQLQERMVHLWQDRLHVAVFNDFPETLPLRDQTLRKFALGRYADLLAASTRDPAMLFFLNGDVSTGSDPNENLGRELLELHTVGTGAYTEEDVRNSALVLTGLGADSNRLPSFQPNNHYVGAVQVMGWSHANATATGGDAVIAGYLDYLAHHPATATHVSTMIARRFVSDTPDAGLVKAMAATYLKSGTNIAAVLRTMAGHKAFAAAVAAKSQGPYDGMIASIRAMQCAPVPAATYPDSLTPLLYELQSVNAGPMEFLTPDGPPDSVQAVSASTVLQRWNLHLGLVTNTFPGLSSPGRYLLGALDAKAQSGVVVDRAVEVLLGQKVTSNHRNQLLRYLNRHEHQAIGDLGTVPGLMAMILDGPYAAVR